jgi:hypothetical protein
MISPLKGVREVQSLKLVPNEQSAVIGGNV